MTAMLDNNILIDAIGARKPFDEAARKILMLCAEDSISGCFSANSATDIFYVLKKLLGCQAARKAVAGLLQTLYAAPVTHEDCVRALQLAMDDFEDALIAACAKNIGADCIVSRDGGFIGAESSVPVISPAELLEKFSGI
jgi:predicted nucleic acid-binding protein